MKLLNAATLKLEEFVSDVPPYAILSHTWGTPLEEVLYADITSPSDLPQLSQRPALHGLPGDGQDGLLSTSGDRPTWMSKKGFRKIQCSATQALSDSLSYVWIDTLCIDKSSSAELSEAINSMFSYYAKAEVCYIYLEDVNLHPADEFGESLRHARWFTRGWTLQELVASRHRFFFDRDWNVVGRITPEERELGDILPGTPLSPATPSKLRSRVLDMESLESFPLSVALDTTLPLDLLIHRTSLDDYCVAEKMCWASKRCTTRLEDTAYCLLGIFNVNMPLLYGEGNNAFVRLQEEIIKTQHDHSIFLWQRPCAPCSAYSGMIATSPAYFAHWTRGQFAVHPHHDMQRPYAITNRGLSMQLPLVPTGTLPGEYIAGLSCHPAEKPDTICYITLVEVGPKDQFARVDLHNHNMESYNTELDSFLAASSLLDVYVHQKISIPPDYNAPRLERFFIQPPPRALRFGVRQVVPLDCWDPASWAVTLRKFSFEPLRNGIRTACLTFSSLSGRTYLVRIRTGFDIPGGSDLSLSSASMVGHSSDDLDKYDWQPKLDFVQSSSRRGATCPGEDLSVETGHDAELGEEVFELAVNGTTRMIDGQPARIVTLSLAPKRKNGGDNISLSMVQRGYGSLRPRMTF